MLQAQCVQWVLIFSSLFKPNAWTCESSVQLFNVIQSGPPFHVRILSKAAAHHRGADSQHEGAGSPGLQEVYYGKREHVFHQSSADSAGAALVPGSREDSDPEQLTQDGDTAERTQSVTSRQPCGARGHWTQGDLSVWYRDAWSRSHTPGTNVTRHANCH